LSDLQHSLTKTIASLESAELKVKPSRPAEEAYLKHLQKRLANGANFLRAEEAGEDAEPYVVIQERLYEEAIPLKAAWEAECKSKGDKL